jgi:hypothetical protein
MVKRQNRTPSNYNSNTFGNYFYMGFGVGLGFIVVQIIFSFIAIALFISGFILLKREQKKKEKGEPVNNGLKIFAYVLMGLAVVFAIFLIIPMLSELGGEDFDF